MTLKVYLDRMKSDENGTFGELSDETGELQHVYTVEPAPDAPHPCIPKGGPYRFNRYESPVHGHTWICQDIPGRRDIEFHNGNFKESSLGCICVGDSLGCINGEPAVLDSVKTFEMLRNYLPDVFDLFVDADL